MREIKFRAWNDKDKEMVYFDFGDVDDDCCYAGEHMIYHLSEIPVMYCMECKDKNGKEIYEGDILVYHGKDVRDIPYHVFYEVKFGQYDNGESYEDKVSGCGWWLQGFKLKRDSGEIEVENETYDYEGLYGLNNMEVIGNIYKNKELLNETQ